jgi:hypothetical protein
MNMMMIVLLIVTFLFAVGASYYKYYYTKDYDYLVEAKCDPSTEKCFFRDCDNQPDLCPPNNLSYYKEYYVKAYDFPKCSDNSCETECSMGVIGCELVTPITTE